MIYVHVPFCKSFCTYCDFYSEICSPGASQQVQSLYAQGIVEEIARRRPEIDAARQDGPHTLYFGGGTPSVLAKGIIQSIVEALGYEDYSEFTVEVNPDDVTPELVAELRGCGANRISMGVQSLDDSILKWMNRRHTSAGALNAFRTIREGGIRNVSLDLIFGLAQLSDEAWREEVRRVAALCPEHISAYALSVEDGSALSRLIERGEYQIPSDEIYSRQYEILCEELKSAGYNHYEISNFAKPGFEAVHNSAYWAGCSYVGLGPGAHSYNAPAKQRMWNSESLSGWTSESEMLSGEDLRIEEVMLRLRTSGGIAEGRLRKLVGDEKTDRSIELGSVVRGTDGAVRIPEEKFFVSEGIIAEIL